jgi:hypothetical protein
VTNPSCVTDETDVAALPRRRLAHRPVKEVRPMTATWTPEDLDAIAGTGEIEIAPRRGDGTLRQATTIWIVRVGDDLYVRSYRGPGGSWYRAARRTHEGRLRAAGIERDVGFDPDHDADPTAIDDAYRAKYGRSAYVDAMIAPDVATTTLRLAAR